ncbi:MAG: ArsR family transcriptional regulator [Haloarculaceae archaeon]
MPENGSMDDLRDEYPSGWRVLVRNESVGYILDALMDALPGAEFTKSELATEAGVSRQSLYTHLDLLLALDVLEPVPESSPQRYRATDDSELLDLLHQVNGTVNRKLSD